MGGNRQPRQQTNLKQQQATSEQQPVHLIVGVDFAKVSAPESGYFAVQLNLNQLQPRQLGVEVDNTDGRGSMIVGELAGYLGLGTVDGQNPFSHHEMKPWLKPWFVGIYTGLLKDTFCPFATWLVPPKSRETAIYKAMFRCIM